MGDWSPTAMFSMSMPLEDGLLDVLLMELSSSGKASSVV